MPVISRFYGILIRMYMHDHAPPHFHAVYDGRVAVFEIEPAGLRAGSISPRATRLVLEWAQARREELLADWGRAQPDQDLLPIAPLECTYDNGP